jgi:hypothetical protein
LTGSFFSRSAFSNDSGAPEPWRCPLERGGIVLLV